MSQDVEGMFHICARGVNTGIDRGVLEGLATGWVGRGGSAGVGRQGWFGRVDRQGEEGADYGWTRSRGWEGSVGVL